MISQFQSAEFNSGVIQIKGLPMLILSDAPNIPPIIPNKATITVILMIESIPVLSSEIDSNKMEPFPLKKMNIPDINPAKPVPIAALLYHY